ncbi:hypothetical protein NKH17_22945 [Mesorhizobium sp. M1334]|uniref:hypothetical protein n=1 Tax=Mesorhizobium sp. M1334 TaxID=2957084 RepID=UPI00333BA159
MLETRLAPAFTAADPFDAVSRQDADTLAVWLGKIHWLMARKSHSAVDHRTRHDKTPERILPGIVLDGMLYAAMFMRCFATNKGMFSCHLGDPPVPEFFYEAPYSLYRFRIDERDGRFESFDFLNNAVVGGVALRSGSVGLICLFDGGLHRRYLSERYRYLHGRALHPKQFVELSAHLFYDQTVLHEDAQKVTYYWNEPLRAVVAQTNTPRTWNPYLQEYHDPERHAHMLGFYTQQDPKDILSEDGRLFTSLKRLDGTFLPFAVTEEELAIARGDPTLQVRPPADPAIRRRLFEG